MMYEPYEPPPRTAPPEEQPIAAGPVPPYWSPPAPPAHAKPPSTVGALLCVLGLGMALIGLFALPLQRYGPGVDRDIGFMQVRNLVRDNADLGLASPLARFWWQSGLLFAAGALTTLTGAVCVARDPRFVRPLGAVTGLAALVSGILQAVTLRETRDYRSIVVDLEPARSMYHDAGLGPWLGFVGLAAIMIGGLLTAWLWRPHQHPASA